MRFAFALALTLAACSSDPAPPPADAGDDAVVVDAGTDAPPADQGAPVDVGADSGELVDTGPLDAGGAVDVSPAADADASLPPRDDGSALDTGPTDTGVDVPRVGLDTGPRDTGPVDAPGVQSYPLDPPQETMEVRVLIDRICTNGTRCGVTLTEASMTACSLVGSQLSFSVRACTPGSSPTCSSVTGLFPMAPSTSGASVSMFSGQAFQATDLALRAGARVGARQSFHVQFRVPYTSSSGGYAGTPGRTVDPERADVWLLGCTVR